MSTLLDRFGDIFSVIMSPLWNHPERMQKLSRFLMRSLIVIVVVGVLVWLLRASLNTDRRTHPLAHRAAQSHHRDRCGGTL